MGLADGTKLCPDRAKRQPFKLLHGIKTGVREFNSFVYNDRANSFPAQNVMNSSQEPLDALANGGSASGSHISTVVPWPTSLR